MSVIKASSLDMSKVTFSDVKTDNHGRKMVYVNYNGGKIMVQTPKMYVPNGVKRWRKKDAVDNKDDSFEMELSFGGEDGSDKNSQEIRAFHEKMRQFDSMVMDSMVTNHKEWLGRPSKPSMEIVEDKYVPTVRVPFDKDGNRLEYPDRIRAKLDRERIGESDDFTGRFLSNKRFKTEVLMFDDNKNPLPMNESNFDAVVPKGSQVVCVLELVYLSISTKVSAKWKLVQAKVWKNQQSITGYALLDDDDEAEVTAEADVPEDFDEVVDTEVEAEVDLEVEEPQPTPKKGRAKRALA
jgi:hypothetical protein